MIHQDGSTHEWVRGQKWDLIVTMEDATNEHYSMFFVEEEGTLSSFRGVDEVITQHGLFSSFYSDRGSHYWHTPTSVAFKAFLFRTDKVNKLSKLNVLCFRSQYSKKQLCSSNARVYNLIAMAKHFIHPVIFVLLVGVLTNAVGWAFNGEVFNHELEGEHHVLSLDQTAHLKAHQHDVSNAEGHGDASHFCLHASGHYQPFFFNAPLLVPVSIGREVLIAFVSAIVPESIPDSPLHPPRNTFAS